MKQKKKGGRHVLNNVKRLFSRGGNFVTGRRGDRRLREELEEHFALQTEENLRAGMPPTEACRQAALKLGALEPIREQYHAEEGLPFVEKLLQDLRYALRQFRKSPGFALVAILSLALGIGANAAIFSLFDAILLRNLPVASPQQLVLLGRGRWVGSVDGMPDRSWDLFSYPFYREFKERNDAYSAVAAINSIEFGTHASLDGGPMSLSHIDLVSGDFFDVLGVHAALGRTLTSNDDRAPGSGPIAVASYGWWTRQGRTQSVLGRTVRIESTNYTIVGIAQRGFFGTTVGQAPDFWIPLSMEKEISPGWNGLNDKDFQSLYLIARLKPNVSLAQAAVATNALFRQIIRSEYLGSNPSPKDLANLSHAEIELTPAARGLSQLRLQMSLPLEILMAVVALVLLIACVNIASLLLARGVVRSREIAVRMALGAGRSRILAQLLTESALLAFAGATLGIALSWKAGALLLRLASGQAQSVPVDASPNIQVLLFAIILTACTTLLFGMIPALRAAKGGGMPSLQEGRGSVSAPMRSVLGRTLIVAQISLSLVLLAGAGLFLHSLLRLTDVNTGFDQHNVLVFGLDEYAAGYNPDSHLTDLQHQIEDSVQTRPGVRAASFSMFTFNEGEWSDPVMVRGVPRTPENSHEVLYNVVGEQYFATFGLPILAGREFNRQDNEHAPQVAVINETMARRFFPGISPIGHRFGIGNDPSHSGDIEIIGVVKDAKYVTLSEQPQMAAYFPWTQRLQYFSNFSVRYSGDPGVVINEVRSAIAQVDPRVLVSNVSTLASQVDASIGSQQLIAQLSAFFSLAATLLVCIGVYGLMSYAVTRRTREIGVRIALGASRMSVKWMILREILTLAGMGIFIGIPVALFGVNLVVKLQDPHLLSRVLYGVNAFDPASVGTALSLMIIAATLAGLLPARRASRVDPMVALRDE
jgi:predicted permease